MLMTIASDFNRLLLILTEEYQYLMLLARLLLLLNLLPLCLA